MFRNFQSVPQLRKKRDIGAFGRGYRSRQCPGGQRFHGARPNAPIERFDSLSLALAPRGCMQDELLLQGTCHANVFKISMNPCKSNTVPVFNKKKSSRHHHNSHHHIYMMSPGSTGAGPQLSARLARGCGASAYNRNAEARTSERTQEPCPANAEIEK